MSLGSDQRLQELGGPGLTSRLWAPPGWRWQRHPRQVVWLPPCNLCARNESRGLLGTRLCTSPPPLTHSSGHTVPPAPNKHDFGL